ncbi:prohibitin family protein [Mechercharimyces sp. CAU 1602]|uniref:prohibitin family protein n=1 Tax=Mechercharimyces sp. CAU 1602 TaxID=2973933 RepID=UPI002162686F|nr:prohibitin family protein [Mechercharimyces sp. CAU 1602]MCS1350530.1 prohibitin family protein [Mechercharimyces sp. CAU 1602]
MEIKEEQEVLSVQKKKKNSLFSWKKLVVGGLTLTGLIIGFSAFTETINQGHAGVVYSRSDGVKETTLSQGLHFVNPIERITEYPVSTETVEYNSLPLATRDGKPLTVDMVLEYFNDVEKLPYIYDKFKGQDPEAIEQTWLKARLKDTALEVTSKYTILEVFQNREKVKTEILDKFSKDSKKHGFLIENVVFGTPTPDKETQQAIQEVVNRQQELEALKIDKQKAKEIAEKQLIEAQGIADAQIEKAKGEAEANRLIAESVTPELLEKMEKEARLKHGWVTINGVDSIIVDEDKK